MTTESEIVISGMVGCGTAETSAVTFKNKTKQNKQKQTDKMKMKQNQNQKQQKPTETMLVAVSIYDDDSELLCHYSLRRLNHVAVRAHCLLLFALFSGKM